MSYDFVIVGAGFAGSVCAERLASRGERVLLIDKRNHIGGNTFDCLDEHGVLIHPYGPHIFHTNARRVFEYLSRFTNWRFYEHRVLAQVAGKLVPLPINRRTINELYGLQLDEAGAASYLERVRQPKAEIQTSEARNSVGPDLCEKLFRGYTRKQWGLDLSELSASVAARIPTRSNDDDRYFTDTYQFLPADGYTAMFQRMLDHPNITVKLGVDYFTEKSSLDARHTVYTGPIDAFYGFRFGKLPYRSLEFRHEHLAGTPQFQSVGTVNYPNDHEYSRITEFKHLTGQTCTGTSVVREFSRAAGDPYYPVPRPENEALFKQYEELADADTNVTFVARCVDGVAAALWVSRRCTM